MRLAAMLCFLSLLVGCYRKPVVIPCPPPPPVIQPILRTASLPDQAPADKVLEAFVLDLADWVGYSKKLQALLDVYRPAPAPPKTPEPSR